MDLLSISLTPFLLLCLMPSVFLWPNHDISTLKLLQVVHRHGDRTPTDLFPNDPFRNISEYWYEGIGELTLRGKHRMYKLGQFIRNHYNQYLGQKYSPREVYVRSSAQGRCLESVSCLLAGAYPTMTKEWQWNNGSDAQLGLYWQPFPIETLVPKDDDVLLRTEKYCPNADKEMENIFKSDKVLKVLKENEIILSNLSKVVGKSIDTLKIAKTLYESLDIEYNRGYKWSDMRVWSTDYEKLVLQKLLSMAKFLWIVEWDNRLIERIRAGNLVNQLVMNMKNQIQGKPEKKYKLMIYSTHDSILAVLMHALNIFNNELIPFSASLLFELHKKKITKDYFVRIYYYNETLTDKSPYLLTLPDCDYLSDCPIEKFFSLTKDLIPEDWDKECGIQDYSLKTRENSFQLFNCILLGINVLLVLVLIILTIFNVYLSRKRRSYESL